ncbi:MAG: hypothetical protein ACJ8GK_00920 [Luteimonas sp.]
MSGSSGDAANAGDGDPQADVLGTEPLPRATRIVYPLRVDGWDAVGEHMFDEQEYGVAIRYAHGQDRDRWIDVYFYPAGALTKSQFAHAARLEADLIRQAHDEARHPDFAMGALETFGTGLDGAAVNLADEGIAVDLQYRADGTDYSSAMVLLLDRRYFVKARYSVAQAGLSRAETREALGDFVLRLQARLSIESVGEGWGQSLPERTRIDADTRELRLEFDSPDAADITTAKRRDVMVA